MTIGQKTAASLLISVLAFCGFAVAAFLGLFDLMETGFYHPAVIRQLSATLQGVSSGSADWHGANLGRFRALVDSGALSSAFQSKLGDEELAARDKAMSDFFSAAEGGLEGLRVIGDTVAGANPIYFSTYAADISKQSGDRFVYRNWGQQAAAGSGPPDEPYSLIRAAEGDAAKGGSIVYSPERMAFLYSFPAADKLGMRRGTIVFAVPLSALVHGLSRSGRIGLMEDLVPVGSRGFALRLPAAEAASLLPLAESLWSAGTVDALSRLASSDTGRAYLLLSSEAGPGGRIGIVVQPEDLAFPLSMKVILLAAFFITCYLLTFLAFNIRQEPATAVRDRVKRFQITLLEEFLERKGEIDFRRWSRELENRREEVRTRIRESVGAGKRKSAEIDELIDKGWDEILELLGSKAVLSQEKLDLKDIERMLRQVLESGTISIRGAVSEPPGPSQATSLPPSGTFPLEKSSPDFEELEEAEEPEAVEELAEAVEEITGENAGEPSENVGEAQEIEEIEAIEELADAFEEAEAADSAEMAAAIDGAGEARSSETSGGSEALEELPLEEVELPGAGTLLDGFAAAEETGELEALALLDEEEDEVPAGPSEILSRPPPAGEGAGAEGAEAPPPGTETPVRDGFKSFVVHGASIREEMGKDEEEEILQELEEDWELSVSALDMSSLIGFISDDSAIDLGQPLPEGTLSGEAEEEEAELLEELDILPDEVSMLSDAERDALEELALAETEFDRSPPVPVRPFADFDGPYVPFFARGREWQVQSSRLEEGEVPLLEIPEDDVPDRGWKGIVEDGEGGFRIETREGMEAAPPGDPTFRQLVESVLGEKP